MPEPLTPSPATSAAAAASAQAQLSAATAAHEAGRLDDARALYLAALEANPYFPEAEHGLAWLLAQQGDWKAALPRFARALKLRPWEKEFWISQLEALLQVGQVEAVHRLLHRAGQSGLPTEAVAGFERRLQERRTAQLAAQVRATGKTAKQAADAPRRALMAMRDAFLKRDFAAARAQAAAVVRDFPLSAFAWRVLGASMPASDPGDAAVEVLRIACDLDPDSVDVQMNLALALHERGRLDEAGRLYADVLSRQPDNVRAMVNQGLLLNARGDPQAETLLRRARALGANDHRVALALGAYLRDRDRCDEAAPLLEEALAAEPGNEAAIAALSVCYLALGRHEESAAMFRRLDSRATRHLGALGIALFVGAHLESLAPAELVGLHRRYGEILESGIASCDHHDNPPDPSRVLRVGFVSGDLCNHAAASFLLPLWQGVDRGRIAVFAYSNSRTKDDVTEALKRCTEGWRDITGLDDAAVSAMVRRDGIDVLIDFAGHTAFNRLGVFAMKPAPVQMSWVGYPGTTGLSRMDYYLADVFYAPPGELDEQFTEKLIRMPVSGSFQPSDDAPDVAPLPCASGQPFTFGSFNRMSKLTPGTIATWCAVMRRLPSSRLVIGAADPASQQRLAACMAQAGVDPSRLHFLPRSGMTDYLAAHAGIDLHLDTMPYAGGTTTYHAMWMGVPTLVRAGATLPSRTGVAILQRAGLDGFIARDADDFIERAVHWADPAQRGALADIRRGLRDTMRRTSVGTLDLAIHGFEDALRAAWTRWCAGQPPAALVIPPRMG